MNSSFDSIQFKINQGKNWDSVAKGWQKWWRVFEKGGQKVSDKLIELAGIRTEQKVLDIATGIGEPAMTAALIVGPKGFVTATDISKAMLEIGEKRAKREGLKNIEFRQVDIEEANLPLSSFDAAICRWGLMFLPNPSLVLENIQRLLIPGGRFAAAVWSESAKVPQLNLPLTIVKKQLRLPSSEETGPGAFSLSNLNLLRKLFEVRFSDIRIEKIQVTFEFDSAQDFVNFTKDIAAPVNALLTNETDMRKDEIWKEVADQVRLKYSNKINGHVILNNEAICATGTRP